MAWTPRDVKDMVVQHPNRFKLVSLGGDLYEITPEPGVVTEPGAAINRAYLQPIEARLNMAGGWRLLQEYKAAGAYTWTAPDLYGDGRDYTIGVFVVGGGGAGGRMMYIEGGCAGGGAAGYAKNIIIDVSPGNAYAVVVGKGGDANISYIADGKNGGSSGFSGLVVFGGEGGKTRSSKGSNLASIGGQSSDALFSYTTGSVEFSAPMAAPAMGQTPCTPVTMATYTGDRPAATPAINIFNGLRYLGAGGGCWSTESSPIKVKFQTCPVLDDGGKGGDSGSDVDVPGQDATGIGNGGGGSIMRSGTPYYAGAGSDGAVMIYV